MSLHFDPVWSWPPALLACLGMLVVLLAAYPRRVGHLRPGWRRLLMFLRLAVMVVLCLMVMRPSLVMQRQDKSDSALYILTDSSRSMQTTDLPNAESRRSAVRRTLEEAADSLKRLKEKADIRYRDFSDVLSSVEQPGAEADGKTTQFGGVLEMLSQDAGTSRVAGVIMLSDGRHAAPGGKDSDPLQAARLLGRQQRPLYTVAYGSSESVDAGQDLALEELDLSRDVFQGNVIPIRVKLRSAGAQNQQVRVRIFLEDRTGAALGVSGPLKLAEATSQSNPQVLHTPAAAEEVVTLQLGVVPQSVGELKLVVEAEPLPGEVRRTNNRVETILRVRQGGIRVAYFDVIRDEQKWLRRINVSSRIQLDFYVIYSGPFAERNSLPDQVFAPGNYDAFIIGNVPASAFSPVQLAALAGCCRQNGAGLMMTGGYNTFGSGGYQQTPLAQLLPVDLTGKDEQLNDPRKVLPTRDGQASFVMQIAAAEQNQARWNQLPPLSGANLLRRRDRSAAVVLAADQDGTPILISQTIGASRVLAFAGDTTWQWAMQGFAEEHQRFWRQVIFWLTKKEIDSEQKVWINAEQRDLTPAQPTRLLFGARDAQGNPLSDAAFEVEVISPSQQKFTLTPRKTAEGGVADFAETAEPGDYWARVRATRGGSAVDSDQFTRFNVNQRDPELDYPAADPEMLRELAHLSGGDFLTADELLERLKHWVANGLPGMEIVRTERITLWDNWYALGLLVLLLTLEWAVRKRRGLV